MIRLTSLAAAILALVTAAKAAPAPPLDCRPPSAAHQACFSVRGRLSAWNGAPTFRLAPRGSKRVLGVVGGDGDPASPSVLTPPLRAVMTPATPGELRPVVGLFRVCPLAPERAGRMRPVCIADASQITPTAEPR